MVYICFDIVTETKGASNIKRGHSSKKYREPDEVRGGTKFAYPFRELFVWAVTNNMIDMALYFWKFEEEGMTKAIIAAHMSKVGNDLRFKR